MLDFICIGSAKLFDTGRERKIQNENICIKRDSNPNPKFEPSPNIFANISHLRIGMRKNNLASANTFSYAECWTQVTM